MSKTKYIKVDVSERLPEKYGFYFVIMKSGVKKNFWFNGEKFFLDKDTRDILYWLEEIPDREEEMIEMLDEIRNEIGIFEKEANQVAENFENSEMINSAMCSKAMARAYKTCKSKIESLLWAKVLKEKTLSKSEAEELITKLKNYD